MARSRGCGRGKLVAPSSLESCWTCCPPVLHFRAAGEGDRAACLLPLPQPPVQWAETAAPERRAERAEACAGEGAGAVGVAGAGALESRSRGAEASRLLVCPERGRPGDPTLRSLGEAAGARLPYTAGSELRLRGSREDRAEPNS